MRVESREPTWTRRSMSRSSAELEIGSDLHTQRHTSKGAGVVSSEASQMLKSLGVMEAKAK